MQNTKIGKNTEIFWWTDRDRQTQTRALKRAWRHGRAWKMKIRAWKNEDPCFNFYKHIYALLYKYPV